MGLRDLLDCAPDAPCDRGPGTLGRTAQRAGPAAKSQRPRKEFDDLIQLLPRAFRARAIVGRLCVVDLVLQLTHPSLDLAARTLIELRHVPSRLGRPIRQLQAMHLDPRALEQSRQIAEALLMSQLRRETIEDQSPHRPAVAELDLLHQRPGQRIEQRGVAVILRQQDQLAP